MRDSSTRLLFICFHFDSVLQAWFLFPRQRPTQMTRVASAIQKQVTPLLYPIRSKHQQPFNFCCHQHLMSKIKKMLHFYLSLDVRSSCSVTCAATKRKTNSALRIRSCTQARSQTPPRPPSFTSGFLLYVRRERSAAISVGGGEAAVL